MTNGPVECLKNMPLHLPQLVPIPHIDHAKRTSILVERLDDGGSRLVDAVMCTVVHLLRNRILPLGIRDSLLPLCSSGTERM
jgi:hypothetical protein